MRFLQHHEMYAQLPMKNTLLPVEGVTSRVLPVTRDGELRLSVRVLSKAEAKAAAKGVSGLIYRVLVTCDCGMEFPFGKLNQHYGSQKCRRHAAAGRQHVPYIQR